MNNFLYSLEVLVNGTPITEYFHEGKIYIEGKKNSEFSLKIKNDSPRRILAIPTVDGLSVINGESANFNSGGYIIDPYSTLKIPGWRISNKEVAKFFFSSKKDSYARKTGKKENLGVIGCAIFQEKVEYFIDLVDDMFPTFPKQLRRDMWTTSDSDFNFDSTNFSNSSNFTYTGSSLVNNCVSISKSNIGTGFGKATSHQVDKEKFQKVEEPTTIMEIYYDDKKGLEKKGIYLGKKHMIKSFPEEERFCQPPKGWKK